MALEREEEVEDQIDDQVETEDDASEDTSPASQDEPKLTETEQVAAELGWAPKSKWRGPPDQWRPAVDFLRRGGEINRELKNRLETTRQEFTERITRSERMGKLALERQRKHLEEQYAGQLRYAASQGDMDAYAAVEKRRDKALEEFEKEVAPVREDPKPAGPQLSPETQAFVDRNRSWWVDPGMRAWATAVCGEIQSAHPDWDERTVLQTVESAVREEFSHKFRDRERTPSKEEPKGKPKVEGGMRPIQTKVRKGYDQLPPEAKSAFKSFFEQGLYGDDREKAKAAYAADYWDAPG